MPKQRPIPITTDRGTIQLQPWEAFRSKSLNWKQGEHLSLIGPTGAGKTTLALDVLPRRKFVVVVATKPKDATLNRLKRQGFARMSTWPRHIDATDKPKVLLWPPFNDPSDAPKQRKVIGRALSSMFAQGGWTIYVDELRYVAQTLRLRPLLEIIWQQGRSVGVSLVGGTQRPAFVPVEMYDQATHLFFWRDNDEANLKRIGGIGHIDAQLVRETVAELPEHSTLYINTRTGDLIETRVTVDSS